MLNLVKQKKICYDKKNAHMKSLNKVLLIGNVTRDPEMRYTKNGNQVCSFGLATNRDWVEKNGEQKEDTEFHTISAWNKLGETCSKYLTKGRKIYVEGRIATHSWTGEDGQKHEKKEIILEQMIMLDYKGAVAVPGANGQKSQRKTAKQTAKTEEESRGETTTAGEKNDGEE
jgi:single-strand DNA-binding protein